MVDYPSAPAAPPRGDRTAGDARETAPRDTDALTIAEQECCHMNHWTGGPNTLAQWRAEFASIPRREKCRDCPIGAPTNG